MSLAPPKTTTGRTVAAGLAGLVILFGGFGGWASVAQIGGAIIAPGQIAVRGKPQEVQHLDGGLIEEIRVADGDRVAAGDVLLTLDSTALALRRDTARAELAIMLARAARLRAEEEGRGAVTFAYPDLPLSLPDMTTPEADARRLFAARAESRAGRADRLQATLDDQDARIAGTDRQLEALDEALALTEEDLVRLRDLTGRGLARQAELSTALRERAGLTERRAGMMTERGRLAGARAAAQVDAGQVERTLREEIVAERAAAEARVRALALEIVEFDARFARVEIRAPSGGIVHDMQVSTAGGVVTPGTTLLQIVPQDRGVLFEIRIDPRQVDQVLPGQPAEVIVAAFDPRSTPRLEGRVAWVSPDTVTDPRSGMEHFRATLSIAEDQLALLGDAVLVPGMPVEAYLKTTDRTVMSYLVDPLSQSLNRALRE